MSIQAGALVWMWLGLGIGTPDMEHSGSQGAPEELGSRLSPREAACLYVSGMFTVRKEPGWLVTGGKGSDGQAPQRKQAAGGVACPSHGLESLA